MIDGRSRDMGLRTVSKLNDIGIARFAAEEERACLKDSLDPLDKYVKNIKERQVSGIALRRRSVLY